MPNGVPFPFGVDTNASTFVPCRRGEIFTHSPGSILGKLGGGLSLRITHLSNSALWAVLIVIEPTLLAV